MSDKIKACLVGGAIGDALGAGIEFYSIEKIISQNGEKGVTDYTEYKDNSGEFTDDTQMTLFTAEGLIHGINKYKNELDDDLILNEVYYSYQRWLYTQGCSSQNQSYHINNIESGDLFKNPYMQKRRAPGTTCLSSLIEGKPGNFVNPVNNSKGCGGIMRAAPVGIVFHDNIEKSFTMGCKIAALTHGHPSGYLSAGFFSSLISQLINNIELSESIITSVEILKKWKQNDEMLKIIEKAINLAENTNVSDNNNVYSFANNIATLGGGWTGHEALAISLFCSLIYKNDFREGVLAAINHSGDSDSTGSITGNILGLINGIDSIPEKWIRNLKNHKIIFDISEMLVNVVIR